MIDFFKRIRLRERCSQQLLTILTAFNTLVLWVFHPEVFMNRVTLNLPFEAQRDHQDNKSKAFGNVHFSVTTGGRLSRSEDDSGFCNTICPETKRHVHRFIPLVTKYK